MLFKHRSILQNIHLKQLKYIHGNIFCFFFWDEDFVSKTINDSNIDLEKFPGSKVGQLAKKTRIIQVYSKTYQEAVKWSTSHSSEFIETPKNWITTKQGSEKTCSRKTNLDPKTWGIQMMINTLQEKWIWKRKEIQPKTDSSKWRQMS